MRCLLVFWRARICHQLATLHQSVVTLEAPTITSTRMSSSSAQRPLESQEEHHHQDQANRPWHPTLHQHHTEAKQGHQVLRGNDHGEMDVMAMWCGCHTSRRRRYDLSRTTCLKTTSKQSRLVESRGRGDEICWTERMDGWTPRGGFYTADEPSSGRRWMLGLGGCAILLCLHCTPFE